MIRKFEGGVEAFTHFTEFLDKRAAMQEFAVQLSAEVSAEILKQNAEAIFGDNTKLADLAPSTQDERTRLGYTPNDPLLRDGELLRDKVEKMAEGHLAGIGSSELVQLYHEYGYHNARTGTDVPARPVFRTAMVESAEEIKAALLKNLGAAMGLGAWALDRSDIKIKP